MDRPTRNPKSIYLGNESPKPEPASAPAADPARSPSAVRGFFERAHARMSARLADERAGITAEDVE